jgi:hypothetical protein
LERKWTFGTLTPQAIPMNPSKYDWANFLRGYQITDSNAAVTLKTIVPGWYSGRTIHIHVMIRTLSSTGTALTEFTTQLFFDQTLIDSLATSVSPYSSRGPPDTTNAEDSIYSNSTQVKYRQRRHRGRIYFAHNSRRPNGLAAPPQLAHALEMSKRCAGFFSSWCYTPATSCILPLGRILSHLRPATAVRFQREVTMESSTLSGPIFYLLVVWGIITAIFLVLLIWRSLLESHEDDQIFIDASGDRMAKEQRDLIQKINTLSRPIMASGVAAGGLLLFIAGFWLYQGLKNF